MVKVAFKDFIVLVLSLCLNTSLLHLSFFVLNIDSGTLLLRCQPPNIAECWSIWPCGHSNAKGIFVNGLCVAPRGSVTLVCLHSWVQCIVLITTREFWSSPSSFFFWIYKHSLGQSNHQSLGHNWWLLGELKLHPWRSCDLLIVSSVGTLLRQQCFQFACHTFILVDFRPTGIGLNPHVKTNFRVLGSLTYRLVATVYPLLKPLHVGWTKKVS